jgi:hypothetical protein
VLTCNDEPHSGRTNEAIQLRRQAFVRAKDFKDHDISVQLIPLARKDRKFDIEAFYQVINQILDLFYFRFSFKSINLIRV